MSCCKTYDPCLDGKLNQIGSYASVARQSAQAATASANSAADSAESAAESAAAARFYLGAFAVAPTTNNEGGPLEEGMLYYNTVSNGLFVWNGTVWASADFNEFTNFIATGTPTARNLATRMTDMVNIRDFGAVGDGVTDDTVAIQAAINYAISTCGAVFIPSGYTFATGDLFLDSVSGCSIIGDRTGHSVPGSKGSNLLYTGTGSCINIGDQSGSGNWQYRFFLKDFSIFFSQNAQAGISAKNISECSFDGISVWADVLTIQSGIKVDGALIVFINQCTTSNTVQGINLISGSAPNSQQNFGIYITQCNLWNHTNSILMGGSHGVNIYGNWIEAFENAIFINNLSDTVTGLEVLAMSINDNVIVQSKQGLSETRAMRIANYVPTEAFYIYGVINNNYIRMDANAATRPTYAISVDTITASQDVDITLTVRDNISFGVTGAMIFADDYRVVISEENNKSVFQYGSAAQAPVTDGPYANASSVFTLLQNGVAISAPNNTSKNSVFTAKIQGRVITTTGSIRIRSAWSSDNNVANDFIRIRIGSPTGPVIMEKNVSNCTRIIAETTFCNSNSKTSGFGFSTIVADNGTTSTSASSSINTSAVYDVYFEVEKANASTDIKLDAFVIEMCP